MPLMLSEELQMENALNGFRGVTDGGCPFWLQRSYRQRNKKGHFLSVTPLQPERASSVGSSSETIKGILRL
jgi:hypothetical protein